MFVRFISVIPVKWHLFLQSSHMSHGEYMSILSLIAQFSSGLRFDDFQSLLQVLNNSVSSSSRCWAWVLLCSHPFIPRRLDFVYITTRCLSFLLIVSLVVLASSICSICSIPSDFQFLSKCFQFYTFVTFGTHFIAICIQSFLWQGRCCPGDFKLVACLILMSFNILFLQLLGDNLYCVRC